MLLPDYQVTCGFGCHLVRVRLSVFEGCFDLVDSVICQTRDVALYEMQDQRFEGVSGHPEQTHVLNKAAVFSPSESSL